jgi:pimeloyl-ACP methyl ester carboxylesterase
MHGFPDNAWSYRKQMQAFAAAGYRAVSPFLRGYAPTEIPADGIFDPIALGRDLEALIAALSDDGQARVVGMDWGGSCSAARGGRSICSAPFQWALGVLLVARRGAATTPRKGPQ